MSRAGIMGPNRKQGEIGGKRCYNCMKIMPVANFHKKKPDGYQGRCKKCHLEIQAAWAAKKEKRQPKKDLELAISRQATIRIQAAEALYG